MKYLKMETGPCEEYSDGWETLKTVIEETSFYVSKIGVTFQPNWDGQMATEYRVRIKRHGKQFSVPFFQGMGHTLFPDVYSVLSSLYSDCSSVMYGQSFAEFAADYGYDTDSIKATKVYAACKRQYKSLSRLFTDAEIQSFPS